MHDPVHVQSLPVSQLLSGGIRPALLEFLLKQRLQCSNLKWQERDAQVDGIVFLVDAAGPYSFPGGLDKSITVFSYRIEGVEKRVDS